MIPLIYSLRKGIRFEERGDSWVVISEAPLNVVRLGERAVRLLGLCDGSRSLQEVADLTGISEEQAFKLCSYFNRKAFLEIAPAPCTDYFPSVSVIIPTKDRAGELGQCLESVFGQDYPKERLEVIVIDDGSSDDTGDLVRTFPCRLLTNQVRRGQSFCRNLGAHEARGEVLAFLDSDCVAGKSWLRELSSCFQWDRIGAVGGYVDGYFDETPLDRYEKAFSPLSMGCHTFIATGDSSTSYAPTCNLLVRKQVFMETGGIKEAMDVGEDVDFCWRMRHHGYDLIYTPRGAVKHKHRNHLAAMLKRRADYGTSEAILYGLHPEKKKSLQVPPWSGLAFLSILAAITLLSAAPLLVTCLSFVWETGTKVAYMGKAGIRIPLLKTVSSRARSYFSFLYFVSFHLIRYYFIPLVIAGLAFHPIWLACIFLLLISSSVDYVLKRPRLAFPTFLLFYVLDHASYQIGVFAGCIRQKNFGSYLPRFFKRKPTFP